LPPKDRPPKKTGMFTAMRNVMPGADLPEVKAAEQAEQEQSISTPAKVPHKGGRHQVPEDRKAVSKAYSFRPSTIQALEAYARDHEISASQAINQALHAMIPENYFKHD